MEYSFNIYHAKEYGVDEAIMIKNFQFWIRKNKSNKVSSHDGRTWTFNSVKAFEDLFPFWSSNQINRVVKSLVDQDILMVGNYNKVKYDRTKWYAFVSENAFVDSKNTICGNAEMDLVESINPVVENHEPIPDVKTDSKQISYTNMIAIYDSFCKQRFDAPAKINGMEGKAMKQIIAYLKSLCKMKGDDSSEAIENSFKYILNKWDSLEPFLQKQVKLSQINSNLSNIINNLKNGTEKRSGDSLANEILNKYR